MVNYKINSSFEDFKTLAQLIFKIVQLLLFITKEHDASDCSINLTNKKQSRC